MLPASINDYVSPAGMRRLWMLAVIGVALSALYLYRVYRRRKAAVCRIKHTIWYAGGLKMSVRIRNISRDMVEIDAPLLEFRRSRMKKRRFRITPPGNRDIFPLGLSPQTGYDFSVEFTRLYERDAVLRKYRKARIVLNDGKGQTIAVKKIKIRLPVVKQ
ncbi:MAG: hypothetical protein LBR08_10310 [Bacteroidales bacterium]|jgi:hypothetical protein|nr:hypothetical protein [Bacteroidales bacterium]